MDWKDLPTNVLCLVLGYAVAAWRDRAGIIDQIKALDSRLSVEMAKIPEATRKISVEVSDHKIKNAMMILNDHETHLGMIGERVTDLTTRVTLLERSTDAEGH